MARKRKYPSSENLSERSLANWIEKVQSRISDQEYYLSMSKGQPFTVLITAERFLQQLKAKRRFLESDLQVMRHDGGHRSHPLSASGGLTSNADRVRVIDKRP